MAISSSTAYACQSRVQLPAASGSSVNRASRDLPSGLRLEIWAICSATARATAAAVVVGVGVGVVAVIGVVVVVLVVVVLVVAVADEVGYGRMSSAEQLVGARQAAGTGHREAAERSRGLASFCIPGLFFCWRISLILARRCHHTVPAIAGVVVAPLAAPEQRAVGLERVALLHRYIRSDAIISTWLIAILLRRRRFLWGRKRVWLKCWLWV